MITKKGLAKEWLIFLGCTVPALLVGLYGTAFEGLGIKDLVLLTLLFGVGLWLIVGLVRSVIWAIGTVRSK
jgi:hypothetical protein